MVYGIVKQHRGWITAFSEPGQGTTFEVYLPAFSQPIEYEEWKDLSLNGVRGEGGRILIVEDDEGVRTIYARILRDYSYIMTEAKSAHQAIFYPKREIFTLF